MAEKTKEVKKEYTIDEASKPRYQRHNDRMAFRGSSLGQTFENPAELEQFKVDAKAYGENLNKEDAIKARHDRMIESRTKNLAPLKEKVQAVPAEFSTTENKMKANDFRVSPSLAAVKNKELAPSLEIVQAIHNKSIADGLDSEQVKAVDKIAVSLMAKVIEQGKAPTANKEKEQQNELAR
jgi:hypothetical protein